MGKAYDLEVAENKKSVEEPTGDVIKGSRKLRILVTVCILVTEMGERLTYYSLVANLILYGTTQLGYSEPDASTINQIFSGFVFLIPIGGGFLSDSYTGRFKTIVGSAIIYLQGILLVVASSVDFTEWGGESLTEGQRRGMFLAGLGLIAVGTGGIKANVGPFGAEQLESLGKDAVQSFFNWFYWVINVGAFIAYAGVSYVQQEISYTWGFFIPLVAMFVSVVIFVSVKAKYIHTEPKGSVLSTAFSICNQGCLKSRPPVNPALPAGTEKKILARAKVSYGGSFRDHLVDGLVSVIKVIPFCVLLIIYWTVYTQMANTFFVQGLRMDVRLGDGINVPVAALNIFNTIAIILLIPVVDRVIYPCFEKMGHPLTYLKRIGIGMVLAASALFVAGIVEIERKRLMEEGEWHIQNLSEKNYTASSLSIFIQIPQFALIGASEIFASISALEFAYNQAPVAMQGLLTGLTLAASGFGSLLSTAILNIVEITTKDDPWWGDEINDVKMENLLFLIGGLAIANFLVFCVVGHYYSYQDPSAFEVDEDNERETQTTNFDGMDERGRKPIGEGTKIKDNSNKYYSNEGFTAETQ